VSYAHIRLVGEAYWWWKDSHSSCRCRFVLQGLLRIRYAPHSLTEFWETLEGIRKIIEDMATKIDINSEPSVLVEPDIVDELYSKVVEAPEP